MVTKEELETKLNEALNKLFEECGDIIKNEVHEKAISCLLRSYLVEKFEKWHIDVEYNRQWNKNKDSTFTKKLYKCPEIKTIIPDIIIHKRKEEKNLVVIEIKKNANRTKREDDIKKINCTMNEKNYSFGAFIDLKTNDLCYEIYMFSNENGNITSFNPIEDCYGAKTK